MKGANIDWQSAPCDWSKMITWSLWREPPTPGHLCVWLGLAWSCGIREVSQNWPSKIRNGIVHHKSDRKLCVIPTADRNMFHFSPHLAPLLLPQVCGQLGNVTTFNKVEIYSKVSFTWIVCHGVQFQKGVHNALHGAQTSLFSYPVVHKCLWGGTWGADPGCRDIRT